MNKWFLLAAISMMMLSSCAFVEEEVSATDYVYKVEVTEEVEIDDDDLPEIEEEVSADDYVYEVEATEEVEIDDDDLPEVEIIEFITLPNGTIADTRLSEAEIDLVLRHFAAIEEGDVAAFQATLGGGQDGVDANHWRYLTATFFPDWAFENCPWLDDFPWIDETTVPYLRNTGLFVREMDIIAEPVVRAVVTNDEGFERTYFLLVVEAMGYVDGEWDYGNFIVAHGPSAGFWGYVPNHVLVTDFIWRNYPSIFMSYQEQIAISHSFLDNGDPSALPLGFILMDEPILPYAPQSFSAFSHQQRDTIIVVRLSVPGVEGRFGAATRVYMFDRYENTFNLVDETIQFMDFFFDTEDRFAWLIIAETGPGPADVTTDFHYVRLFEWIDQSRGHRLWSQFIREPMQLDVPRDEANDIYATLTPLECIIDEETRRIIEARSLHALSILNKEE